MTKSEVALCRIRSRIFSYPEHKAAQASRVLSYLKSRVIRHKAQNVPIASRGPFSGLTQAELRQSKTLETDWF